jgi:hypothetical protein
MLLSQSAGHAGEVKCRVAMQLNALFKRFPSDLAAQAHVQHRTFAGP